MVSPLAGSLARAVGKAMGSVLLPVTLSRSTEGYYDPATMTYVPGETATFTGKGMIEDFDSMSLQRATAYADGSLIQPGDRKVLVMAHGLGTTPEPTDEVTVNGEGPFAVQSVTTDPAGATFSLIVR